VKAAEPWLRVHRPDVDRHRNTDHGWPYYAGNSSRLEPTAWATLAGRDGGCAFFASCQQPDGLLIDPIAPHANSASHALALIAAFAADPRNSAVSFEHAVAALVRQKGIRIPFERQYYQNNRLEGWSWCPHTFSWVEPTAWALVALKKAAAVSAQLRSASLTVRIADGERVLVNRACVQGGWNYGNSNMYGRELRAHVPTTAIALLALQDHRDEPAVRRGLAFLQRNRLAERTGIALALTAVCLSVYGEAAGDVCDLLPAAFATAAARAHVHSMAMVLYAMAGLGDGYAAFRL
jgi:hypothetical protein